MTASTYAPEFEELTDETRKRIQLDEADRLTMVGHIRKLLKMRQNRVADAWGQKKEAEADDDMQLLARDVTFNRHEVMPTPPEKKPSRWPLAATLLATAVPATAGLVMLPEIIAAWNESTPAVDAAIPADLPEYIPMLLPGKPPS